MLLYNSNIVSTYQVTIQRILPHNKGIACVNPRELCVNRRSESEDKIRLTELKGMRPPHVEAYFRVMGFLRPVLHGFWIQFATLARKYILRLLFLAEVIGFICWRPLMLTVAPMPGIFHICSILLV